MEIQSALEKLNVRVKSLALVANNEDTTKMNSIAFDVFNLLMHLKWETNAVKKCVKILLELESRACFHENLMKFYQIYSADNLEGLSQRQLNIFSALLDGSTIFRSMVEKQLQMYFKQISASLEAHVDVDHTLELALYSQTLIKISLQLFQIFNANVTSLLPNMHESNGLLILANCLLMFIQSKKSSVDIKLLAGTGIAFLINLHPEPDAVAQCGYSLYKALASPGSHVISLGDACLCFENQEDAQRLGCFSQLAFLNGLVSCAKEDVLCCKVSPDSHKNTLLLLCCFDEIQCFCQGQFQYHSFQLLSLWYKKVLRFRKTFLSQPEPLIRDIYSKSLTLIWTHLDSPVDGVNEYVISVLDTLLQISVTSCSTLHPLDNKSTPIHMDIFKQAGKLSWQIKGKLVVMATVMKYMNLSEFLQQEPDVLRSLLECMKTNYLAPSATLLYKAILKQIKLTDNPMEEFQQLEFSLSLVHGLCHENSLLSYNVSHLWIPATLKELPEAYPLLVKQMEGINNDSKYIGIMALHNSARQCNMLNNLPVVHLSEALNHPTDDVRLAAFVLICNSNKKAESMSMEEMDLLRKTLPFNMNIDSAPFRQQLQSALKNAILRTREACLASLKKTAGKDTDPWVLEAIDFLDWLWNNCLVSIRPGSNFQRMKTSLELMNSILDCLSISDDNDQEVNLKSRKGHRSPTAVKQLIRVAHDEQRWNFFTAEARQQILSGIVHGTDEIRELCALILTKYYPWPMTANDDDDVLLLLNEALNICQKAKAHESQAGAILVKLIFMRLVHDKGYVFTLTRDSTGYQGAVEGKKQENNRGAELQFISLLIEEIERSYEQASRNPLKAALHTPAHGLIISLQHCCTLVHLPEDQPGTVQYWQKIIDRLIICTKGILDIALSVLGGRVHDEDSAPSFEQMSLGIQDAIKEYKDDDIPQGTTLTFEHQLLMTWCWLNIREINILHGKLVESFARYTDVISLETIKGLGDTFLKVLTRCRHRGAIEGCNLGFMKFCTTLLKSSNIDLQRLPEVILTKVLKQVSGPGAASSITRRSAGLPLIVQSIISAESKVKLTGLLQLVTEHLLDVLSKDIPENSDGQHDFPQVHALNILKAIFRESAVAMTVRPYLDVATIHAIKGFASPHWAIRNGAIQLLGTLIQRMLGQKKTRDDHLNTMTMDEFFSYHSELEAFLFAQLQECTRVALEPAASQKSSLHPSLFPVLTILAKLGAGVNLNQTARIMDYRKAVLSLATCPVMAVRKLASRALLPLVAQEDALKLASSMIEEIPNEKQNWGNPDYNLLHGRLLILEQFLNSPNIRNSSTLKQSLADRHWILSDPHRCFVVKATFLSLLLSCGTESPTSLQAPLLDVINRSLDEVVTGQDNQTLKIGYDQYLEMLLNVGFSSTYITSRSSIFINLTSADADVVIGILKLLIQKPWLASSHWTYFQDALVELVVCNKSWTITCCALELLWMVCCQDPSLMDTKQSLTGLWACVMALIEQEPDSQPASLALLVSSLILKKQIAQNLRHNIGMWCEVIHQTSSPLRPELHRLRACKALNVVASDILSESLHESNETSQWVISIYNSYIALLCDDQPDVRQEAAKFIQNYQSSAIPVHSNLALKILHESVFLENFKQEAFILNLITRMIPNNNLESVLQAEIKTEISDMFEAEDLNPYKEKILLNDLAISSLKPVKCNLPTFKEICSVVQHQLDNVCIPLENHCTGKGQLNASCAHHFFTELSSILDVLKILLNICALSEETINEINQLSTRFLKIPNLHPVIVNKLSQLGRIV